MTTIHDWKTNKSEFAMWDAKTLKVAFRAELDTRVPNGFHGTFVQENDY
jgi:carotenoid cleavage dioxygenase-like enzyme